MHQHMFCFLSETAEISFAASHFACCTGPCLAESPSPDHPESVSSRTHSWRTAQVYDMYHQQDKLLLVVLTALCVLHLSQTSTRCHATWKSVVLSIQQTATQTAGRTAVFCTSPPSIRELLHAGIEDLVWDGGLAGCSDAKCSLPGCVLPG